MARPSRSQGRANNDSNLEQGSMLVYDRILSLVELDGKRSCRGYKREPERELGEYRLAV